MTGLLRVSLFGLVVVLLGCSGGSPDRDPLSEGAGTPRRGDPPLIRVLLSGASGGPEVVATLAGPFRVTDVDDVDDVLHEGRATGRLVIQADDDGILVDGVRIDEDAIRVDPGTASLGLGSRIYRGALVVSREDDGSLEAVLSLDLEGYVAGVVAGEMPGSFPDAALQAQVVAARTYVLNSAASRAGAAWDVTDDTRSQMFVGVPRGAAAARFEAAVTETRGLVLLHGARLFPCYYHGTCGGTTASAAEVFGGPDIPALAGVPCGTCGASPRHTWEVTIPGAALAGAAGFEGTIGGVTVASRTPSGRAATLRLAGSEPRTVSAAEVRRALRDPALPSTGIESVVTVRGGFRFRGYGHGHGVGLCQYGAAGRAERGWSVSAILRDYYPGTTLARIY